MENEDGAAPTLFDVVHFRAKHVDVIGLKGVFGGNVILCGMGFPVFLVIKTVRATFYPLNSGCGDRPLHSRGSRH